MPTALRSGPYRMFFFAGDGHEPPHVHVERDDATAKVWLEPARLQGSAGFARAELIRVVRLVEENRTELLEAWHDYFGG